MPRDLRGAFTRLPITARPVAGLRVKPTPGSQLALLATYDYHALGANREGEMIELEADRRRHAAVEDVIHEEGAPQGVS